MAREVCEVCDKELTNKSILKHHTARKHKDVAKTLKCPFCSHMFYSFDTHSLDRHLLIHADKRHKCTKCNSSFSYEFRLNAHIRKAHGDDADKTKNRKETKWKCKLCKKSLSNKPNMEIHYARMHKATKTVKCRLCPRMFYEFDKHSLSLHEHTHNVVDKKHKCHRCGKQYSHYAQLRCHTQIAHGARKFTCSACPIAFPRISDLTNHQRTHSEERSRDFTCIVCGLGFYRKENLKNHISNVHQSHIKKDSKVWKCKHCEKILASKHSMQHHIISIHEKPDKTLHCKYCDTRFYAFQKYHLTTHVRTKHTIKPIPNIKKVTCKFCSKSFLRNGLLNVHIQQCHSDQKKTCTFCQKDFSSKITLARHVKTHVEGRKKNVQCLNCDKTFYDKSALSSHEKYVHVKSGPRVKCQLCDKDFSDKSHLKDHLTYVHAENKWTSCPKCNKRITIRNLNRHIRSHDDSRIHQCEICQKLFKDMSTLHKHKNSVHATERKFKCVNCSASFKCRNSLGAHKKIHLGIKAHSCQICGKSFMTSVKVRRHMVSHSSDKDFECSKCKKKFNLKGNLNAHLRRHEITRKSFQCDECKNSFLTNHDLWRHKILHKSPNILYKCSTCMEGFRTRETLKAHSVIHASRKDHPCTICKASFSRKSELQRHTLRHSNQKPRKCEKCQETFRNRRTLKNHMFVHSNNRRFKCKICGLILCNRYLLSNHMKTWYCRKSWIKNISKRYPYVDTTTETSLYKICSLNMPHGRIGYKCNICQKVLYHKHTLRQHLQRHVEGYKILPQGWRERKSGSSGQCDILQNSNEAGELRESILDVEFEKIPKIGFTLDVYNSIVE